MAGQQWRHSFRILWIMTGLLSFLSVREVESFCSARVSQALLDLKGDNSSAALSSWRPRSDCCRGWAGVTCDAMRTHVISLNLTGGLQLLGANVSKSLCNLYELQVLNISVAPADVLYVQIPDCIWNMTEIRYLDLGTVEGTTLQGALSSQVCNLRHLTHLGISGHMEDLELAPDCLWAMTKLEYLELPTASLSESFSSRVCNLTNLKHLHVVAERYEDVVFSSVPACIWKNTKFENLSLVGFSLPSSFPLDVCNLTNLVHLDNTWSNFYGHIPKCIWNLTKLQHLGLQARQLPLGGYFSADICNLKNLSYLSMYDLIPARGYLPACLWNLTGLEVVKINFLTVPGSFSPQMCNIPNLQTLQIPDNNFTGVLPACIWSMSKLEYLDLSRLDLSNMEVPTRVSAPSLRELYLSSSNLSGAFLDAIGNSNLSGLQKLDISDNSITTLPDGIQDLSHLESLSVPKNLLTRVPAWIGKLQNLSFLDISQNSITTLPDGIQDLSILDTLIASDNLIADTPTILFNLSQLHYLDMSSNLLTQFSVAQHVVMNSAGWLLLKQNSITEVTLTGSGISLLDLSQNFISDTEALQLNLSGLQMLELPENRIKNIRPLANMLNLSELIGLGLAGNSLEEFPPAVNSMTELSRLNLSNNPIGDISGLCHLQQLGEVYLSNISLSTLDMGVALPCLKNLSQLWSLDLSSNNISGDLSTLISSSIYNLTELSYLFLFDNNISGDLAIFSRVLPKLQSLDISGNQLSGEVPKPLLSLSPRLEYHYLNLSRNQLGGRLSEVYGYNWILDLSQNHFEGPLPSFSASTFMGLAISSNNFTGSIPQGLSNSTLSLQSLNMSFNKLSGNIPNFWGDMKTLQLLDLTSNRFDGSLPEELGNCKGLQHLRLKNNGLRGHIPSSIGKIGKSLLSMAVSSNNLEGPIPSTLGNCASLQLLDLSHNNLSGTLPSTLANLSSSLRVFTVASNRLSGPFPAWIVDSNFTYLQVLDLSNNSFNGSLPTTYSELFGFINGTSAQNNQTLYDDSVEVSAKGNILTITYFVVSRISFDVSSNHFSGYIPKKLGDLKALRYLTLAGNTFSGKIPAELSNLQELESLDLARNSLNGSIPSELDGIPRLSYFNVSDNYLTGPIPLGAQFSTFTIDSFRNNTGLCSISDGPLPRCPSPAAEPPTRVPDAGHHHSWTHAFTRWMSFTAFFVGFGTSFGAVGLTFLASKSARSVLFVPHRKKVRKMFEYSEPYGAYVPKS